MAKKTETLEQKRARLKAASDKKIAQIDAQIKAQRAREKTKARKADTRRKVILGGLAGVHMARNPSSEFTKRMTSLIDEYTIGNAERALFDLSPLPPEEQKARRARHAADRKQRQETERPF